MSIKNEIDMIFVMHKTQMQIDSIKKKIDTIEKRLRIIAAEHSKNKLEKLDKMIEDNTLGIGELDGKE